jgi:hypothetical protein
MRIPSSAVLTTLATIDGVYPRSKGRHLNRSTASYGPVKRKGAGRKWIDVNCIIVREKMEVRRGGTDLDR